MSIFQVIIILLAALMIIRASVRIFKKEMTALLFVIWAAFWLVVIFIDIHPAVIDRLAARVGVGRGVDLLIYFSLIFVFYFLLRFWLKIRKIEKDITEIVQKAAINSAKRKGENNENV